MLSHTHWLISEQLLQALEPGQRAVIDEWSFKIGSVIPDFQLSHALETHNKEDSMYRVQLLASRLYRHKGDAGPGERKRFSRRLGMLTHYLCDFFCQAHNPGDFDSFSRHLAYEYDLACACEEYDYSGLMQKARTARLGVRRRRPVARMLKIIDKMHANYLRQPGTLNNDIRYSFAASYRILCGILETIGGSAIAKHPAVYAA